MKNLRTTESLMTLRSRSANREYAAAYYDMLTVFRFYDDRDCSCHCKLINMLYNVSKRGYTFDRIARDSNISDNALRRYRRLYAEWFLYFLEYERSKRALKNA